MTIMNGEKVENLYRMKGNIVVGGVTSKKKKQSIEVELCGMKSSKGPKLQNEQLQKGKEKEVLFSLAAVSED